MSRTSNTKRYYEIARNCLQSAQHANNPATRDKLLDQAQLWMDAAMRETFIATIGAGSMKAAPLPTSPKPSRRPSSSETAPWPVPMSPRDPSASSDR
jgi:hypothetical protein